MGTPSRRAVTCVGAIVAALALLCPAAMAQGTPKLPGGLVYLRDVDPTIVQDIRYAQADNFTGGQLPGYGAAECILTKTAAQALAQVQADLKAKQFSLKVYDCYRPVQAVRAFVAWAEQPENGRTKRYYPNIEKTSLFRRGYIARSSGHSRGATVDLTIVGIPAAQVPAFDAGAKYGSCTGAAAERAPDTTVDMGTGFDCFDTKSHTAAGGLTAEQSRLRRMLVEAMQRRGFANFKNEWWHFTHGSGGSSAFDFPIRPRDSKQ